MLKRLIQRGTGDPCIPLVWDAIEAKESEKGAQCCCFATVATLRKLLLEQGISIDDATHMLVMLNEIEAQHG